MTSLKGAMSPGGTPYDSLYGEAPPEKIIFFQASGIWKGRDFTSWSIKKRDREICHLDLWKGPKGLTD